MTQQTIVIGVFEDRKAVVQALEALRRAGFRDQQLGFAARKDEIAQGGEAGQGPGAVVRGIVGGIMGAVEVLIAPIVGPSDAANILESTLPVTEEVIDRLPYPGSPQKAGAEQENETEAQVETQAQRQERSGDKRTVEEERTSMITGGVMGGVTGAGAALLIPGIGPAVSAGLLAATLGGAAIGSIAGGFLGAFTHLGVPRHKASYYEQEFRAGRTIVTVQAEGREQEAVDILRNHGAHDVAVH